MPQAASPICWFGKKLVNSYSPKENRQTIIPKI